MDNKLKMKINLIREIFLNIKLLKESQRTSFFQHFQRLKKNKSFLIKWQEFEATVKNLFRL